MAMELEEVPTTKCCKCGKEYTKRKAAFYSCSQYLYKGCRYIPVCRNCIEEMYNDYLQACGDPKIAIQQICRKLDLYYNESLCNSVIAANSPYTVIGYYIAKVSQNTRWANKSFDDTLQERGMLWTYIQDPKEIAKAEAEAKAKAEAEAEAKAAEEAEEEPEEEPVVEEKEINIPRKVMQFWGPGYTPEMYRDLEQRRQYWMSRMPNEGKDISLGEEALIRQICSLEIDINAERASKGKNVDKYINSLNTLLGSLNMKPVQQKETTDTELENTPLGVGIQKWEYYRPLPATPDDQKDVNGRVKDILTWFTGHLCKMAGVKNFYSRMYEEAMDELRVERPDIDEDDDMEFQSKFFETDDDHAT